MLDMNLYIRDGSNCNGSQPVEPLLHLDSVSMVLRLTPLLLPHCFSRSPLCLQSGSCDYIVRITQEFLAQKHCSSVLHKIFKRKNNSSITRAVQVSFTTSKTDSSLLRQTCHPIVSRQFDYSSPVRQASSPSQASQASHRSSPT